MANTYSQIYIQVVFAVAGRENLIAKRWRDDFYKYISGIVREKDQKLISIGGVEDPVHILFGIKPKYCPFRSCKRRESEHKQVCK